MPDTSTQSPVLVFGGPYSNLAATRALRAEADRLAIPPSRIICTGDVVAYCAEPEDTVREIRDWGITVVAGNCEAQLAAGAVDCGCGFAAGSACDVLAKNWYEIARTRVSPESVAWMAALPSRYDLIIGEAAVAVIHGGFAQNNRFIFASDSAAMKEELARTDADIVVAGHSGIPFVRQLGRQTWFNPGVIGVPANDATADTWYGLIAMNEDKSLRLTTHRLRYDAQVAAKAMEAMNSTDAYAKTLTNGLWPSLDVLPFDERARAGQRLDAIDIHLADLPSHALAPTARNR